MRLDLLHLNQEMMQHAHLGGAPRSHEALNAFFVARMRALTEAGLVLLQPGCSPPISERPAPRWGDESAPVYVDQVCGQMGDIVLMHPLLLHSGTTNEGQHIRMMANGMVQLNPDMFARVGHPLLRDLSNCASISTALLSRSNVPPQR